MKLSPLLVLALLLAAAVPAAVSPSASAQESGVLSLSLTKSVIQGPCGPLVNPDGTYYAGDQFEISYVATAPQDTSSSSGGIITQVLYSLTSVTMVYNATAFTAQPSVLPPPQSSKYASGSVLFTVLNAAVPQRQFWKNYTMTFTALGNEVVNIINATSGALISTSTTALATPEYIYVTVIQYNPQFTPLITYTYYKDAPASAYDKKFVVLSRYDGNGLGTTFWSVNVNITTHPTNCFIICFSTGSTATIRGAVTVSGMYVGHISMDGYAYVNSTAAGTSGEPDSTKVTLNFSPSSINYPFEVSNVFSGSADFPQVVNSTGGSGYTYSIWVNLYDSAGNKLNHIYTDRAYINNYTYGITGYKIHYNLNFLSGGSGNFSTYGAHPFSSTGLQSYNSACIVANQNNRYIKLLFSMNRPDWQNITATYPNVDVNMTFNTKTIAGSSKLFNTTYAYYPLVFMQPVNITAYMPSGTGYAVDGGVQFNMTAVANPPYFDNMALGTAVFATNDGHAIDIFHGDLYSNATQVFTGSGYMMVPLLRTAFLSYNVTLSVTGHGKSNFVTIDNDTISFSTSPYNMTVNLVGGGLDANATVYGGQGSIQFNALPQSGGLAWIAAYDQNGNLLTGYVWDGRLAPASINSSAAVTYLAAPSSPVFGSFNPGFIGQGLLTTGPINGTVTITYENVWGVVTTVNAPVVHTSSNGYIPPNVVSEWIGALIFVILAYIAVRTVLKRRAGEI